MAGKTISIFLSDAEYQEVERLARKECTTVTRYIKSVTLKDNIISKSVKELAARVEDEAQKHSTAFTFNVKMMFGTEWANIGDDGDKRAIGRAWYNYVSSRIATGDTSITIGKKDSAGQWYIRENK